MNTVDLDSETLESLYHSELHCQADHSPEDVYEEDLPVRPCSIKVVGRKTVTCVGISFFICQNSFDWNTDLMFLARDICSACRRNVEDCFELVLI